MTTQHAGDPRDFREIMRERAESYWRDAEKFAADGDAVWAAAYRCISSELRGVLGEVGADYDRCRAALEKIARADYRGNEPASRVEARKALGW